MRTGHLICIVAGNLKYKTRSARPTPGICGTLHIDRSLLINNPNLGFESDPGIFVLAGEIDYTDAVIE